jgi:hypothetical protein
MPLKLNVGTCKKIGQPDYGSLGASCNVEIELDQSLLFDDLDACREAVAEELARQQQGPTSEHAANHRAASPAPPNRPANGQSNGHSSHLASRKQIDYAQQLAGQIHGLGARRLETLANKMFGKPLGELSSLDASGLIDSLKEVKAGKIDLAAVLGRAAI